MPAPLAGIFPLGPWLVSHCAMETSIQPSHLGLGPEFPSFRPWQLPSISQILSVQSQACALTAPTGCVAGDTLIQIARGTGLRKSNKICIQEEFRLQWLSSRRNRDIVSYTRSYCGTHLRSQAIKEVVYSGQKPTYLLRLSTGNELRATAEHEILTTNGYVELTALTGTSRILVDAGILSAETRAPKRNYRVTGGLVNHPFAGGARSNTIKNGCLQSQGRMYRVAYHRLVVEASMNGISVEELIQICRTEPLIAASLVYLDPDEFAVHHQDGNHQNNELDNLEVLTHGEHARRHDPIQHLRHQVKEANIESISLHGIEDTFDLVCAGEHPNFVANGIVIHNSGKTLIAVGSALLSNQRVLYLCSTKAQAQQVLSDFQSVGAFMLHGHNNFRCYDSLRPCDPKDCDYDHECKIAQDRPIVITNNAHWFALGNSSKRHLLGRFDLIIYDEAHKVHDILCGANQIQIDRYEVRQHLGLENFPSDFSSIPKWIEWANTCLTRFDSSGSELFYSPSRQRLYSQMVKISYLNPNESWHIDSTLGTVTFSPIWGRGFSRLVLGDNSKTRLLFMSATLSPKQLEWCGVTVEPSSWISLPCPFPVSNRPVIFYDAKPRISIRSDMLDSHKQEAVRRMAEFGNGRLDRNSLIQCQSYEFGRYIADVYPRVGGKAEILLPQSASETPDMVQELYKQRYKGGLILISPSIKEGMNFPDGVANFNILAKIPWLVKHDPIIKRRCEEDDNYEIACMASDIQQACGRTNRSMNQKSENVITDSSWLYLIKQHRSKFQEWFRDAWRRVVTVPVAPKMHWPKEV